MVRLHLSKKHLNPTPIIIAERYKFYHRSQEEGESLCQHLAELRKIAQYCDFGDILQQAIRDRFVCGKINATI